MGRIFRHGILTGVLLFILLLGLVTAPCVEGPFTTGRVTAWTAPNNVHGDATMAVAQSYANLGAYPTVTFTPQAGSQYRARERRELLPTCQSVSQSQCVDGENVNGYREAERWKVQVRRGSTTVATSTALNGDCTCAFDCVDPATGDITCPNPWYPSGTPGARFTYSTTGPSTETNCGDNIDNDCDGQKDEFDTDCPVTLSVTPTWSANEDQQWDARVQSVEDNNFPTGGLIRLCTSGCTNAGACIGGTNRQIGVFPRSAEPLRIDNFQDDRLEGAISGTYNYHVCIGRNSASDSVYYRPPHCGVDGSHSPGDDLQTGGRNWRHYYTSSWQEEDCRLMSFGCACTGVGTNQLNEVCDSGECRGINPTACTRAAGTQDIIAQGPHVCNSGKACQLDPGWCSELTVKCHRRDSAARRTLAMITNLIQLISTIATATIPIRVVTILHPPTIGVRIPPVTFVSWV